MDVARTDLRDVLLAARSLIARPDNDFDWSSWPDADSALRGIDGLIATLENGLSPSRLMVTVLFAPTGPIEEVSLSSGWAEEYLVLSARADAAVEVFYDRRTWWRRLLTWKIA